MFSLDIYAKIVIGCFIFLVIFGLIRIFAGKKGSWTESLNPEYGRPKFHSEDGESLGETRVRNYLETYMKEYKFEKTRPFFLNNTVTGHNLELDFFCKELNLGIEYNGKQHYHYTPYFHPNKEAFQNQKYRDELKKIWCRDRGIYLITIPYSEKNVEEFLDREIRNYFQNK